ncbi:MAG: endonuclease MutS2 [Candidatus Rokuibacteriota bacterium]|nr:MAG: endonuclease MutS2 [Candidatus Rokubacteria bacterium]
MGREQALGAAVLVDVAAVQSAVALTGEARLALDAEGPPPLDGIPDIRPVLARGAAEGSALEGVELVRLISALDAGPRLQAWGRAIRPVAGAVARLTDDLPRLTELRDTLRPALEDDGSLTDRASPRLRQLRQQIRDRRRRLVADLERMLAAEGDRLFADRFVTVRHGRYVLPVRAEARQRVRGIVHDRSQSGQTIFVEPEGLIEANNDLVQALREEEQETARILAELTAAVRARLDDLERLVAALGQIDWLFARAHAAVRMDASAPVIDLAGRVALRAARHPLLLAQAWRDPARTVVPVDVELSPDRPLLLITGPNAGGKTIALKTLALCALMAQVGCHVPAAEGSRLPVFERLYAIIGDEQSVAENLSTFSAFVKQIREVLDGADSRSLVLVDELGAGTDPDEGAALARAILETLADRGTLVAATTHLEPLRAFASTEPRARNASVEFDTRTLAPTFRLRYDIPGQSYALAIAGRLGLSPELIARAQGHRSTDAARMSQLIAQLDEATRSEAERALALERRERESTARLAAAQEAERGAAARARDIVERAKAEAARLLIDVRRAVSAEWERLKRTEPSRPALDGSRRRLREVGARVAPAPVAPDAEAVALAPGMAVAAEHLGLRGQLVAIAGDSATVRAGSISVRVPVSALRPAASNGVSNPAPARDRQVAAPARTIAPELMLIGRTTAEVQDLVEKYLDDAFMAGVAHVRLVHGKGTGALRKAVRGVLSDHPLVASFRDGEPAEGGAGATVAALTRS